MIPLHDTVLLVKRVQTGTNQYGQPVYSVVETPCPAEVRPLGGDEAIAAAQQVITRFRVFLPPTTVLAATDAIKWRGIRYELAGDVEPHTFRGQVHHFEVLVERVTG